MEMSKRYHTISTLNVIWIQGTQKVLYLNSSCGKKFFDIQVLWQSFLNLKNTEKFSLFVNIHSFPKSYAAVLPLMLSS